MIENYSELHTNQEYQYKITFLHKNYRLSDFFWQQHGMPTGANIF